MERFQIATIPGDGIGVEVTEATFAIIEAARQKTGGFSLKQDIIHAGAAYYRDTDKDIEADGEERAGLADAIYPRQRQYRNLPASEAKRKIRALCRGAAGKSL